MRLEQMKHLKHTLETYMYNHCHMSNILIYFCNIGIKHLQHVSKTSETLETYVCNMRWNLAYVDVYVDLLREKNIVRSLKSNAEVVQANRAMSPCCFTCAGGTSGVPTVSDPTLEKATASRQVRCLRRGAPALEGLDVVGGSERHERGTWWATASGGHSAAVTKHYDFINLKGVFIIEHHT
jgi:hypothetical protein